MNYIQTNIKFSKKWFNPLYFILCELLKEDSIRFIFIYGGKGSSKTVSIAQLLLKEALIKKANSLSFRKESSRIKASLKNSFNLALDSMFIYPAFKKMEFSFVCNNGAELLMKGLDDSEKIKGIEGFKYLYIDEINQFTNEEFNDCNMSLRGMLGQKLIASWNPVDERSWVKVDLIDTFDWVETNYKLPCENSFVKKSACGRAILIKTTYQDNYWINGSPCKTYGFRDENLIKEYEELRVTDYNKYKVNVLGEYGKSQFGGEFLKCWKSEKHVIECSYDENLAIYLSFDENVNPYLPCGIFQVKDNNKTLVMIDCITAKNPNNTLSFVCNEVKRKLKQWGHKGRVFITGDATSKKEDVKQEKGNNLFKIIEGNLKEFNPTIIVSSSNPNVVTSAAFLNSILEINYKGLAYYVDKNCNAAITDYEYTKEDKNGKIDKKTITDPNTKISYQPYGHIVDLTRYVICAIFNNEYNMFTGNTTTNLQIGYFR